jgi:hypothetical protein
LKEETTMTQQTANRPRDPRMPVGVQHKRTLPSDVKIQARVGGHLPPEWKDKCPLTGRFFEARDALQSKVRRLRDLAQKIDKAVAQGGQAARLHAGPALASAGRKALKELEAERARIEDAREVADGSLQQFWKETFTPKDRATAMQIRDALNRTDERERRKRALEHLDDRDVAAAVLAAPPLASGLSRKEWDTLRMEAERRHAPDLQQSRHLVSEAHERVQGAARVAEEMIAELAGLELRHGQWRAPWEVDED